MSNLCIRRAAATPSLDLYITLQASAVFGRLCRCPTLPPRPRRSKREAGRQRSVSSRPPQRGPSLRGVGAAPRQVHNQHQHQQRLSRQRRPLPRQSRSAQRRRPKRSSEQIGRASRRQRTPWWQQSKQPPQRRPGVPERPERLERQNANEGRGHDQRQKCAAALKANSGPTSAKWLRVATTARCRRAVNEREAHSILASSAMHHLHKLGC